jgi:hypothetical protein
MANPISQPVWKQYDPIWIRPNGDSFTLKQGDFLYIDYDNNGGRNGIYKCVASIIVTSVTPKTTKPPTYDFTDFDSHVNSSEFIIQTGTALPSIVPWKPTPIVWHLEDRVYLTGIYAHFYVCLWTEVTQATFSIFYEERYPYNSNNKAPERVTSGIRNEGWYLYPRGTLSNLQFVPKFPGMMYLCTDPDNRSLYAYTDGKGPAYGWDKYAQASDRGTQLVVGMIIGWLWSPDDSIPPPPNTLKCDNTRVSKTTYAKLYAVIGDKYKQAGDPSDNLFRLPEAYNQVIFTGVV